MKKGFIRMTNDIYNNNWDIAHQIFKDFKPTHIEFRRHENDMWYFWGTCDSFDELKEGEEPKQYIAIFVMQDDKTYRHSFQKMNSFESLHNGKTL